jgi:hypothetical protein
LPWNDITDENLIHNSKKCLIIKNNNIPKCILDFLRYILTMEYEEKPNYYLIIDNFKSEIEFLSKNN